LAQFKRLPWGAGTDKNVIVEKGVLHVWGAVVSEAEVTALRVAAERIPGVIGFVDQLTRWPGAHRNYAADRSLVHIVGPASGVSSNNEKRASAPP
jgi:hypothetical protein